MPSNEEMRTQKSEYYYQLLNLKKLNEGKEVIGLNNLIGLTKASMLEPDIAWVEKNFADSNK
jgi:hypothetical protein